jgi:hypothetical protein
MKNIQAIKVGNVVNVSINGKLHKKNCGNSEEADELFRKIILAKQDPTDANIKSIYCLLNEKIRAAMVAGLEHDADSGEIYLAGFNTPIPKILVNVILEYHKNSYPLDAIINFWKLLMINPDIRVRESLFNFIQVHDFVLTDNGYMIVYKAVVHMVESMTNTLSEFVGNQYQHVKKDWGCSPNKYVVYEDLNVDNSNEKYYITKVKTASTWNEKKRNIQILGKLGDLFNSICNNDKDIENPVVYTDKYSHSFRIVLGETVRQKRKICDSDPLKDCSIGLHVGATKYVETFADKDDIILVCYINPANVIAVPSYYHSKMRVSEYFPFALATYKNGKIDTINQSYFESDYQNIEQTELEKMVEKVKMNELPIEKAKNCEEEERPLSELKKILETRLIDITMDYKTER